MQVRTRRRALIEGIVAGVLFGTAAVFIRYVHDMNSFSIVFWRVIIGCLALGSLSVVLKRTLQISLVKENLKELLILGFFLALHFVLFTFSVRDTTILNATVLVNTTPIFSMLVSNFVFKLKPSPLAIFGLAISFIGLGVIAYAEMAATNSQGYSVTPTLKGDMEAILAATVEAFYLNYGRKTRNKMNILSIMTPIYGFVAIFVGVVSVSSGIGISQFRFTLAEALPIVGLGLLPTAIAHTLYFSSLSNLKSFETATMALLEPIGATILGIAAFREVPAPLFALGAVIVLIGVFFILRRAS